VVVRDGLFDRRCSSRALLFGVLLLSAVAGAAEPTEGAGGTRLRVMVDEDPPFVVRRADDWAGWAIDLWTEVARRAQLDWEIFDAGTPDEVVATLVAGRADVGVGDISVTKERAARIDFSHPYFHSGLRILVRRDRGLSVAGVLADLSTSIHARIAVGLVGLLLGMSALVFVLARRHDPKNFPQEPVEGAIEALYVATTALLKGNLDRKLLPGIGARLLTIAWLFLGTAVVAYFTAAAASVLTVRQLGTQIQTISDLAGKRVATLQGRANGGWLAARGIAVVEQPDLASAVASLEEGSVDAVVHDAPVLAAWLVVHPASPLEIVGHTFDFKDYALALTHQSALRVPLNLALLELEEEGFFADLDRRWLGPASSP
jgi:polar amino acid transport system substrate-binding protein